MGGLNDGPKSVAEVQLPSSAMALRSMTLFGGSARTAPLLLAIPVGDRGGEESVRSSPNLMRRPIIDSEAMTSTTDVESKAQPIDTYADFKHAA